MGSMRGQGNREVSRTCASVRRMYGASLRAYRFKRYGYNRGNHGYPGCRVSKKCGLLEAVFWGGQHGEGSQNRRPRIQRDQTSFCCNVRNL